MADSRAEGKKFAMSLEHLVVPESMQVLKKQKNGGKSMDTGTNLIEFITTKAGTI